MADSLAIVDRNVVITIQGVAGLLWIAAKPAIGLLWIAAEPVIKGWLMFQLLCYWHPCSGYSFSESEYNIKQVFKWHLGSSLSLFVLRSQTVSWVLVTAKDPPPSLLIDCIFSAVHLWTMKTAARLYLWSANFGYMFISSTEKNSILGHLWVLSDSTFQEV